MLIQALIDQFRRGADDLAKSLNGDRRDVLWSDDEVVTYLNAATDEACERALLVEDATTAECCTIPLVAGQAEYPLHPSVIRVKRAAWGRCVLDPTSTEEMDEQAFGWEIQIGRPRWYIEGSGSIRLARIPRAEDVAQTAALQLTVYRKLLVPITTDDDLEVELPDIPSIYHLRLLDWVYHLAYSKRDADTFDAARALQFDQRFTASFGMRPDANVQRKRRDRRPPIVRMRF